MSTIDKRIVEMEFDNKQFEKGVSTSMDTLDKLNRKLELSDGSKGLTNISKAVNSVDLSGLETGIEALNKRFSAFGIAGMTIIKNLTEAGIQLGKNLWNNTIGQIVEGGRSRAQNLQQAKFMLKGLDISWEEAYDAINNSVEGTAYSLDKAAMSCASLSASGVKLGKDMEYSLGAISGLAAISGDSYDHIAEIFKSVASLGHVTAMDLNRIQGVNIWQDMAKKIGVDMETFRKLVSKGAVDFQTFADIIYAKYFEVAKGANELTSGAIDNFKSALSRIGEGFQTPWLAFIRDAANAIRPLINDVKNDLAPAFKFWGLILERVAGYISDIADYLHEYKPFKGYVEAFGNLFRIAYFFIVPVAAAIREMFGKDPLNGCKTFGEYLAFITEKLGDFLQSSEGFEKVKNTTKAIVRVLKGFYDKVLVPVGTVIAGISVAVFKLIQLVINLAVYLYHITPPLDEIKEKFFALIDKIQNSKVYQLLSTIFNNLVSAAKDLWAQIKDLAIQFYNLSSVQRIIKGLGNAFEWVKTKAGEAWTYVKEKFFKVLEDLAGTDFSVDLSGIDLTSFDEGLNAILDKLGEFKGKVVEKFEEIKEAIVEWFKGKSIVTIISEKVEEIKQKLKTMKFQDFVDKLKDVKQKIIDFKDKVIEAYNAIKKALRGDEVTNSTFDRFAEITGSEIDVNTSSIFKAGGAAAVGGIIYGLIELFKGLKHAAENINSIGDALVNNINALTGCLQEMQKRLKPNKLKSVAQSVLMMAVAIGILALLPFERLAQGLIGLSVVGLELWAFTKAMSKIEVKDLKKISQSVLLLSASIFIIAMAVKKIGKLGLEGAVAGTLSIVVLMYAMTGVIELLVRLKDKFENADITQIMKDLIIFAAAIDLLAIAVRATGKLDKSQAIQGTIVVGVLMGLMAAFAGCMMFLKNELGTDMPQMASMLLSLAVSMVIMSAAVALLGIMKPEQVWQGVAAVGVLLIVIAGFAAIISATYAPVMEIGAGMLLLALAMVALVIPIVILGKIDFEDVSQGILAVVALLGAFTLAAKLLGATGGDGASALMGIAVAMVIMAAALIALGLMIVPATLGIIAITVALLVLIAAGYLLVPVTVFILAAAAAMLVLGTGVLLAGVGFAAFGSGLLKTAMALKLLSTISAEAAEKIGTVLAAAIAGIAAGIGYLIKAIAIGVVEGIAAFLKALADASLSIAKSLVVLGTNLLAVCYALLPLLLDFIGYAIAQVLIVTAKYTPQVVQAVMDILIAILTAINNNIYQIVELVGCIMLNVARALIDYIPQLIIISMEMVVQMIQGFIAALDIYGPVFILAYKNFWLVIGKLTLQLIEEMFGDIPIIGEKITEACENAKQSMTESIADNNEQIDAARESAREIMEEYTVTMGSEEYKTKAGEAADGVTDTFIDTAYDKGERVASVGDFLGTTFGTSVQGGLTGASGGMPQSVYDNYIKPMQDVKADADKAGNDASTAFANTAINKIGEYCPDMKAGGEELIGMLGDGAKNGNVDVESMMKKFGGNDVEAFLDGAKEKGEMHSPSKATERLGKNLGDGFVNGADKSKTAVRNAGMSIATSALNGLKSKEGQSRTVGSNFSQGFALGIRGKISSVSSAAASIGAIALRKLKAAIDSNSPSKETMEIGKFFDAGFAVGIAKYNRPVDQAIENLGTNAIDVMRDSVSKLSSVMGMDLDNIQPTISPVLDLNGIQAGMDGIDSIFSRQQAVKANVEMSDWKSREYSSSLINGSINDMIKKSNENSNKSIDAIKALTEKVDSLEVRLDSGELVGGIVEKMDNAFGTRTMRQMRSN